jgi:hypothetical protein
MTKLTFILMVALSLAAGAHGQTPITQDNIYDAVDACLTEDPVSMNCPGTEYGAASTWNTGGVTYMANLFCSSHGGNRAGKGQQGQPAPSTQLADISALANWDMSAVTEANESVSPPCRAPLCASTCRIRC